MNHHDDPFGEHADIDRWATDEYAPQTSRMPGVDALPDGAYTLEIVLAELGKTVNNPESIFRLQLRVLSGPGCVGLIVERPSFFRSQANVNRLGGDMLVLGFPADQWGKRGKSWSAELITAAAKLPGLKVAAVKRTQLPETPGGKTYHNLDIIGRSNGPTAPPAAPAPAPPANVPASVPENAPAGGKFPWESDDIPF